MDHENKYKEALEKARQLCAYPTTKPFIRDLQDLFPELKESEGERIRKIITLCLNECVHSDIIRDCEKDDAIAWLEKQGEQKPVIEMKTPEESLGISSEEYNKIVDECIYGEQKPAWSEEDREMRMKVLKYLSTRCNVFEYEEVENWLKSLKDRVQPQPKQEWGEEDEKYLIYNIEQDYRDKLNNNPSESLRPYYNKVISLLKSLRPQNRWISIDEEVYVKEPVLAQKKDKSDPFKGFVVCCDHMLIPNVYERYMILGNIVSQSHWKPSEEMLEALYRTIPQNVMEKSEDEILLDKLYQGLKYGKVLSKN